MKKGLLVIVAVMLLGLILSACSGEKVKPPIETEAEMIVDPISKEEYDAGEAAINLMFDYTGSHATDKTIEELNKIQEGLESAKDGVVYTWISTFILDIQFDKSAEEIIKDIEFLQLYLAKSNPEK